MSIVAPVRRAPFFLRAFFMLSMSEGSKPFGAGLDGGFLIGLAGASEVLPFTPVRTAPSFGMFGGGAGMRGSAAMGPGMSGGGAGTLGSSTNGASKITFDRLWTAVPGGGAGLVGRCAGPEGGADPEGTDEMGGGGGREVGGSCTEADGGIPGAEREGRF